MRRQGGRGLLSLELPAHQARGAEVLGDKSEKVSVLGRSTLAKQNPGARAEPGGQLISNPPKCLNAREEST